MSSTQSRFPFFLGDVRDSLIRCGKNGSNSSFLQWWYHINVVEQLYLFSCKFSEGNFPIMWSWLLCPAVCVRRSNQRAAYPVTGRDTLIFWGYCFLGTKNLERLLHFHSYYSCYGFSMYWLFIECPTRLLTVEFVCAASSNCLGTKRWVIIYSR